MNSFQLKRVLEEGLHHDHTTDGEYHNSEIKQSPNLLGAAGKRHRKAILPHRKLPPFGPPPPLRIFVALREEGMAIFWNYTIHVLFTWKIEVMKCWILTWLQLEDKNGIHWTKMKGAYFVVKVTRNVENYHDDFSLITGHLFHVIALRTTVDEKWYW